MIRLKKSSLEVGSTFGDKTNHGATQSLAVMTGDAQFSPDRTYRYWLSREWPVSTQSCAFIMLNPSTATAEQDDPTIRRCVRFAQGWGYGTLYVVNLFAFCATDQTDLKKAVDPIGPDNDQSILAVMGQCSLTIAAWGVNGVYMDRHDRVLQLISSAGGRLWHLGLSKAGHPMHPLYLPANALPTEWQAYR